MKKNNDIFAEYLREISSYFESPPVIYNITQEVRVIAFKDQPEVGWTFYFSFGLSSVNHPEWINSKPELIVAVESYDSSWGITMGEIIALSCQENLFQYGDLFYWDMPISQESKMDSYFLYANSWIDEKDAYIRLSDRYIHFSEMYPIYEEEKKIIHAIGPTKFFLLNEWDRFNVKRKMLDVKKFCN